MRQIFGNKATIIIVMRKISSLTFKSSRYGSEKTGISPPTCKNRINRIKN